MKIIKTLTIASLALATAGMTLGTSSADAQVYGGYGHRGYYGHGYGRGYGRGNGRYGYGYGRRGYGYGGAALGAGLAAGVVAGAVAGSAARGY